MGQALVAGGDRRVEGREVSGERRPVAQSVDEGLLPLRALQVGLGAAAATLVEHDEVASVEHRTRQPLADAVGQGGDPRSTVQVDDGIRPGRGRLRHEPDDRQPHLASLGPGAVLRDHQATTGHDRHRRDGVATQHLAAGSRDEGRDRTCRRRVGPLGRRRGVRRRSVRRRRARHGEGQGEEWADHESSPSPRPPHGSKYGRSAPPGWRRSRDDLATIRVSPVMIGEMRPGLPRHPREWSWRATPGAARSCRSTHRSWPNRRPPRAGDPAARGTPRRRRSCR